jgi:hypothetical protein
LLHRGGVYHIVDVAHGEVQAVAIADVADEIAHEGEAFLREHLRHFVLLQLIAGKDDETARLIALGDEADKMLAEGAGAAGHENRTVVQIDLGQEKIAALDGGAQRGGDHRLIVVGCEGELRFGHGAS